MGMPLFELPAPDLKPWRQGNTGIEGVWQFEAATPGRDVLLTALVHGNELCGAWALLEVLRHGLRPRRGRLTLAWCNLAAFDRFDAADSDASRFVDRDFNRVWGAGLDSEGIDSLELRRARELRALVDRADCLLDLHSMHQPGPPLVLTGPHERNVDTACALGLDAAVLVDAGHAEGTRMRDHGRFGAAIGDAAALLVECGWHGALSSRAVALDATARFLAWSGTCDASDLPATWRRPSAPPRVLEVSHAIVARSLDTRFASDWPNQHRVARAGTVLGWREGEPFSTPYDDCVLVMPSLHRLRPGVTVVRLARERPGPRR